LIEADHPTLSVTEQCALLGLPRSSWYYQPVVPSVTTQELLDRLDEQYTRTPFYGSRRMTAWLRSEGYPVNRKRVRRLLQLLGLETIYPKPKTSTPAPGHRIYPYLLRGLPITYADQVWSSDITYIRLAQGWLYLVAILDWYSRYVVAWEVSNSLDSAFCVAALERALAQTQPGIFNTDQGSQFTSQEFTGRLRDAQVRISMDGRGRALDNVFVERLWRTVKYRRCISRATRRSRSRSAAWASTSGSTTRSGCTRHCGTGPRRRCIKSGRAEPPGLRERATTSRAVSARTLTYPGVRAV